MPNKSPSNRSGSGSSRLAGSFNSRVDLALDKNGCYDFTEDAIIFMKTVMVRANLRKSVH